MTRSRTVLARLSAGVAAIACALALGGTPAQANSAGTNYILNGGGIGVGVMHLWDGSYTQGSYDVVLSAGGYSSSAFGWSYTEGFYIGSGYCSQVWYRYTTSDSWARYGSDVGSGQHYTSRYYYWKVVPYAC
ncbi:hypothetical protein [Actinoplanes sp. NPDC051851]|uniref:hypothetical protein n=1 Tax=Actinoplanes sp. NPDC051851 TaxID=3154753 RepID=UPI0034178183